MSDRTINFGESETEATYQIQDTDSTGGGNFVVAKDTNANTVLLQYDPGADTWEYAGDVDMNGGKVSGVGTLTAESVNTEEIDSGEYLRSGNRLAVWELDSDSPYTSNTITDIDDFRMYWIVVNSTDASTSSFRVQVNGDDGNNYDYYRIDGSEVTGDNRWDRVGAHSDPDNNVSFFLQKSLNNGAMIISDMPGIYSDSVVTLGVNESIDWPLTEINILGLSDNEAEVYVYGWSP